MSYRVQEDSIHVPISYVLFGSGDNIPVPTSYALLGSWAQHYCSQELCFTEAMVIAFQCPQAMFYRGHGDSIPVPTSYVS